MTLLPQQFDELHELIGALCNGEIDAERFARLQAMLSADIEAQQFYVRYMDIHGALRRLNVAREAAPLEPWGTCVPLPLAASDRPLDDGDRASGDCMGRTDDLQAAHSASVFFRVGRSSLIFRHFDSVSAGGVVPAYLGLALLVGVGLLAAWVWNDPGAGSADVARPAAGPAQRPGRASTGPQVAGVAWVIAMSNCRWADPATAADIDDPVPVGRRYALRSGWLQIRYQSGAIVVIYGPAVYQVDSDSTGLLISGKASSQVDWTREPGELGHGDWALGTINSKVFAIQTSDGRFNNLGGYFSVTVDVVGRTDARVISGTIEAIYPRDTKVRHLITSRGKGWYAVKGDDPRGHAVLYKTDEALPAVLRPLGESRYGGFSAGTWDLQQWRAQHGLNPKPKSPMPN